jgi:ABC-type Fe3+ transport system substrate-binding protein
MQAKIFIFVPINIGRNLESLLKRKAPNTEFITPSSSSEELKYFAHIFENPVKEELPELIVTLQPDILKYFEKDEVRKHYMDFTSDFPELRADLKEKDLDSSMPFVKPLLYTPIIMLVNKDVKNPPKSWKDLLDPRFHGKILAPDAQTPVSIAFDFLMKDIAGNENAEEFFNTMKYSGLPFDVITGVNKGFYDVGLLPLPFARYNMGKNLETLIPEEGAIVLPEVMFIRKDASPETIEVAKDLFGKNIQRFFSQLGALIPVIEEIPLPVEVKEKMNFYWKGWDWYKELAATNKK